MLGLDSPWFPDPPAELPLVDPLPADPLLPVDCSASDPVPVDPIGSLVLETDGLASEGACVPPPGAVKLCLSVVMLSWEPVGPEPPGEFETVDVFEGAALVAMRGGALAGAGFRTTTRF